MLIGSISQVNSTLIKPIRKNNKKNDKQETITKKIEPYSFSGTILCYFYYICQKSKTMKKIRVCIICAVTVFVGLVAFGLWSRPQVADTTSSDFSATRVISDIEVISKEHHSVAHPAERAVVRNYLVQRLKGLGADSVKLFEYKSLTGPENKHVVYTFDATNILAHFAPKGSDDATNLLLVAHYDSRYSQPMPKQDTVWSYGAADDGYGIGVILETLNLALKYRDEWKQGIKVLFTDAEEVGMKGMKAMWESNREQFNDVGLVINIEARGPFGPALLFETSPGNEKLMELYGSTAHYPFTYSLTTVVYSFMPNFTDFTIIKDEIPGLNFSTVADINHYHTDLDNFDNINPRSIQHYGAQITPIVRHYLTGSQYSDRNSLVSSEDSTNFTIPLLGLFNFSKSTYRWVNISIFTLFLLLFGFEVLRGRAQAATIWRNCLKAIIAALVALVAGEAIAFIAALIAGAKFKPFGIMQGIKFDNTIMIISAVAMTALLAYIYIKRRKAAVSKVSTSIRANANTAAAIKYATNSLYSALMPMLLLGATLLVTINENLMFFIPLAAATIAIILYRITRLKVWLLIAVILVLLHALSFLYALTMALTIGAFGAVLMLATFDTLLLLPLYDLYTIEQ